MVSMDKPVVIIGCGIIGATLAKVLRKQGEKVTVIDAVKEMSGTKPSGGHLKPSWFSNMAKDDYTPAMDLLQETWGLKDSEFTLRPTGLKTTVYRVDTDEVVKTPFTKGTVSAINTKSLLPEVSYRTIMGNQILQAKKVVVCAGVWCSQLLPQVFETNPIQSKRGVSFRVQHKLESEFIQPWSPYKQIVAHQQSADSIWIGDGSAILADNWTPERTEQCKARCLKAIGSDVGKVMRVDTGIRPYCKHVNKKDPCLFQKVTDRIYVATGSGKSGTISAGWVAHRLLQE